MKTWKKIEETKKRTNDITGLKKRNEEKVQKVGYKLNIIFTRLEFVLDDTYQCFFIENLRHKPGQRNEKTNESEQLYAIKVEV